MSDLLVEPMPGYATLAIKAKVTGKTCGVIGFVVPGGHHLSVEFEVATDQARSATVLKNILHESVEKLLSHGLSNAVKK